MWLCTKSDDWIPLGHGQNLHKELHHHWFSHWTKNCGWQRREKFCLMLVVAALVLHDTFASNELVSLSALPGGKPRNPLCKHYFSLPSMYNKRSQLFDWCNYNLLQTYNYLTVSPHPSEKKQASDIFKRRDTLKIIYFDGWGSKKGPHINQAGLHRVSEKKLWVIYNSDPNSFAHFLVTGAPASQQCT